MIKYNKKKSMITIKKEWRKYNLTHRTTLEIDVFYSRTHARIISLLNILNLTRPTPYILNIYPATKICLTGQQWNTFSSSHGPAPGFISSHIQHRGEARGGPLNTQSFQYLQSDQALNMISELSPFLICCPTKLETLLHHAGKLDSEGWGERPPSPKLLQDGKPD
jgi:hypothetical protein